MFVKANGNTSTLLVPTYCGTDRQREGGAERDACRTPVPEGTQGDRLQEVLKADGAEEMSAEAPPPPLAAPPPPPPPPPPPKPPPAEPSLAEAAEAASREELGANADMYDKIGKQVKDFFKRVGARIAALLRACAVSHSCEVRAVQMPPPRAPVA